MMISKARTIAALSETWSSLDSLLDSLTDAEWAMATPLPGWDVKDNVTHIIGTESMLAGLDTPAVEIDRETTPHVRNDIGTFNEAWVQHLRDSPPADVLARFRELTAERLAVLESMTNEEWEAESFTPAGRSSYGRFMQIRVFDSWLHEQDIRDAVGRPGHATGLSVDVTLDELTTAMGFVVGKKAGAQPGQSVTFALEEEAETVREIHVTVHDRAQVVSSLEQPATVRITLPVGTMTRLGAGRVPVDDVRDAVTIEGDLELGERVIGNLNYTI